jgi:nucleoside diphosphate kinase
MTEIDSSRSLQKALLLIKPDAVRDGKVGKIEEILEQNGFVTIARKEVTLTKAVLNAFYGKVKGMLEEDTTAEAEALHAKRRELLLSGPSIALVLSKVNCVRELLAILGPASPEESRAVAPRR